MKCIERGCRREATFICACGCEYCEKHKEETCYCCVADMAYWESLEDNAKRREQ